MKPIETISADFTSSNLSHPDLLSFLLEILLHAAELVETPHGYIYLIDPEKQKMELRCSSGVFSTFPHRVLGKGEGIAGHVWLLNAHIAVDDYSKWEGRLQGSERDILKAVAGFPLKANGRLIGVIGLAFVEHNRRFSEKEIRILEHFSRFASLSVEHTLMEKKLQQQLELRKQSENELRLIKHIVEQAPLSIIITDTDGKIEYANPGFLSITGYTLSELAGKNPSILKSGRTSAEEYRELWETIKGGEEWRGEFQNLKKSGEIYWEKALISPIRDNEGNITHFIGIKEDITEQKALENQLRHSQKMEAVGRMAAGMAHDFNNILTAIIGYANIVQMQIGDNELLSGFLTKIITSSERGAELTRGLLAFSRKQISNPVLLDMNSVVDKAVPLIKRIIHEGKKLVVSKSDEPLQIIADSMEMEQIILNLSTNANDATSSGGTISLSTGKTFIDHAFILQNGFGAEGSYITLTVSDNRTGIPAEIREKIFEPFFTTKETGVGTGLGLAIIYGIVKKNKGFIQLSSEQSKGTAFTLYFPEKPADSGFDREPAKAAESSEKSREPLTILIAEDEDITRNVAAELLSGFGYKVFAASDGKEAMQLFEEHEQKIDLIILDWVMPETDGKGLLAAIRKQNAAVPVIISSGYGDEIEFDQSVPNGRCLILPKPFSPKELLHTVQKAVKNV